MGIVFRIASILGFMIACVAGASGQGRIQEEFKSKLNSELWVLKANGSKLEGSPSGLQLMGNPNGTAFPEISTRGGLLAFNMDWKLRFAVRYNHIGPYGAGYGIRNQNGDGLFVVWAGSNLAPSMVANDHGVPIDNVVKKSWDTFPGQFPIAKPTDWHQIELDCIDKRMVLRIDGVEQVAFDAPKGEYAAWFGNNATGLNPWDWCQLQVRSLDIEYPTTTPPGYDLIKKSMTKSQGINIPIGTPQVKKDPVRADVSLPKSTSQGLDRLHLVFGTDVRQSAPVLLGSSDRIRLTGRSQKISTLPKTTFELAPQCDLPDFKPTEIALFVGGQRTRHEYLNPGATLPIFSFESSGDILDHTKLTVKAIDKKNRTVELMSVEVDSGATLKPDTLKMILNDERIEMMGAENAGGSTYLFLGHDYLGAIKGAGSASVDARRLPAGQYELFCVGTRSDGTILPVTRNIVNISPRYQILSDESDGTAVLEGTKTSVTISVKRSAVAKISKTRLYAADRFVGANDTIEFTTPIPLGDAPSGDVSIVLIGVGSDGTLYAPETISVRIKNPLHDAFIARDARASKLQQMLRKMSNFDQDVAYWYERAKQEPAFKTYMTGKTIYAIDEFGRMASLGYIESITIPGDPGRYLAECKAAVVRRAQHRLEIGQIQKLLGLRDRARGTFEQVIEEVGAKSGIGLAATQELMSL